MTTTHATLYIACQPCHKGGSQKGVDTLFNPKSDFTPGPQRAVFLYSERWRHDRLGLKFEFGFLSSLNKFNMTNYTYAESISSDTETKTHRSTSDKLALVRDN